MRRSPSPLQTHTHTYTKHWSQTRGAGHEPSMGGIVPGDMATAVTAGGGTAGQRKKSVRTENHVHLQAFPENKSFKGRWPSSDHTSRLWDWKFFLYN